MSNKIDEEKLESLAKELAMGVKTEQDLADLSLPERAVVNGPVQGRGRARP